MQTEPLTEEDKVILEIATKILHGWATNGDSLQTHTRNPHMAIHYAIELFLELKKVKDTKL